MVQACNPSLGKPRQEDHEFKARLTKTERLSLKEKKQQPSAK